MIKIWAHQQNPKATNPTNHHDLSRQRHHVRLGHCWLGYYCQATSSKRITVETNYSRKKREKKYSQIRRQSRCPEESQEKKEKKILKCGRSDLEIVAWHSPPTAIQGFFYQPLDCFFNCSNLRKVYDQS